MKESIVKIRLFTSFGMEEYLRSNGFTLTRIPGENPSNQPASDEKLRRYLEGTRSDHRYYQTGY